MNTLRCLSSFPFKQIQGAQHSQGNQSTPEDQDVQGIQEKQDNQHFKTGNHCWFKGCCAQ
jgi:hypothetical protein